MLPQAITEPATAFHYISGLAEFFSQPPHMRINRARVDDAFVAPHVVEQTVACLDAAASLHERLQKFKFEAGEVDSLAIDRNFVARRINPNRADRQMFRSEEHTSELQSRVDLVCRLLL